MISVHDRSEAALLALQGVSLGDAFGQSFLTGPEDPRALVRRRELPPGPWRWSDDTVMAAALTEELALRGEVVPDELAANLARRYAADPARGYGSAARDILAAIHRGVPWAKAAQAPYRGQGSMGNGAAMRVAPAGAYYFDDEAQAARAAVDSARVTHAHPEGQAGAVAVAVAAAWLRARQGKPWSAGRLLGAVLEHVPTGRVRDGVKAATRAAGWAPADVAEVLGDGGQVIASDTVPYALWCVEHHGGNFEGLMFSTMEGLLNPAADRDTICAIVGGLAAVRLGRGALPRAWLERREPLPSVRPRGQA